MKPSSYMKWLQVSYSYMTAKIDFAKVPSLHVTAIVRNGKVLLVQSNKVGCPCHTQKQGPRYLLGPSTFHAEVAAVRALKRNNLLKDADMFVWKWKVGADGCGGKIVKNSRPCKECETVLQSCMKKYGLRRVYYST